MNNEYQILTLRVLEKEGVSYTCFEWFDTETNQTERRFCKNINEEPKDSNS